MPYRLKRGEPVPEGIKRVVYEEIDSAVEQLARSGPKNREEAVHEARKSIKKIRGVLRLVRPELGGTYRKNNRILRDVGRQLSEIRDVAAVIEVFDGLVARYRGDLDRRIWTAVQRGLEQDKREIEKAVGIDFVVRRAAATLQRVRKQVNRWPLEHDEFRALSPGLQDVYRRGRKALTQAQAKPTPENYHYFRKRVKDHWYHVRLLESLWTQEMEAREASLKDLETWLGDDHNLVLLVEKFQKQPEKYGQARSVKLFQMLAQLHQNELREKAISMGTRLYEQKPRQFTRTMSNLWDVWQRQPDPPLRKSKKTAA